MHKFLNGQGFSRPAQRQGWWCRAAAGGLLVAVLLLAACASLPPPGPVVPAGPAWDTRAARLPGSAWTAEGRFAVTAAGRQGGSDQGGQGSFRWQRSPAGSVVEVSGPFGIGRVTVFLDERGARFEQNGEQWHTGNPEGELLQRFGFTLPVRGLDSWLRGLPAPLPATPPAPGTVGFTQDGWTVDYPAFDAVERPLKLVASRPGMRVRAVIERWQEDTPSPVVAP